MISFVGVGNFKCLQIYKNDYILGFIRSQAPELTIDLKAIFDKSWKVFLYFPLNSVSPLFIYVPAVYSSRPLGILMVNVCTPMSITVRKPHLATLNRPS